MLGGAIYNIVVENELVASQLLKAKSFGPRRVTLLPNNKMAGKRVSSQIVDYLKEKTQGNVELAIDLIEFNPRVRQTMESKFGSIFVAMNNQSAKAVSSNGKSGYQFVCANLEGDVYKTMGELSGGYQDPNQAILKKLHEYRECGNARA